MIIPNNGFDEDCDGENLYIDEDLDGFHSGIDCDDNDPNVNSYAVEVPNNDIDENCDGVALIIDVDGDGFNSDEDCDDYNPSINPGAEEIEGNDVDENCNGDLVDIEDLVAVGVNVFPNPATDFFQIESEVYRVERTSIYTTNGALVNASSHNTNSVRIDISDFESGFYVLSVKLEGEEKIYSGRLLKL